LYGMKWAKDDVDPEWVTSAYMGGPLCMVARARGLGTGPRVLDFWTEYIPALYGLSLALGLTIGCGLLVRL
jgi:hypothetical protein